MLQLTAEEQTWLDAYREALNKKHPEAVQEMPIYGSKSTYRGSGLAIDSAEKPIWYLVIIKK
jgi:hypothetical protein